MAAKINSTPADASRQEHQFQFRGIHLPAQVVTMIANRLINETDIILLIMIESLVQHGGPGCFASNPYFGKTLGIHRFNVAKTISKLKRLGLVTSRTVVNQRFLETAWSRTAGEAAGIAPDAIPPMSPGAIHNKDNKKKSIPQKRRSAPVSSGTPLVNNLANDNTAQINNLARRLYTVITAKWKIPAPTFRTKSWGEPIRLLRDKAGDRVDQVIAWLEKHATLDDDFTVSSAKYFRAQFSVFEKKMKRDPRREDVAPHPDTGKVMKRLSHLNWPPGVADKIPRAVSQGLKNLEKLSSAITAAPTEVRSDRVINRDRARSGFGTLITAINYEIYSPTEYVANYFENLHRAKAGWKAWSGWFRKLTFKMGGKDAGELERMCRSVALESCGTEQRWDQLKEAIDL